MPDEQARTDRARQEAREEATEDARIVAKLEAHEQRLIAINHSSEKTSAQLEVMMAKFEMIATMIMGLGHRIDISDGRFKSAQETMEITAKVLRDKTQQDRDNANSSRDPWRFGMLIIGAVGVVAGIAAWVMKAV